MEDLFTLLDCAMCPHLCSRRAVSRVHSTVAGIPPNTLLLCTTSLSLCRTDGYDPVKSGASSDKVAEFVGADIEGPLTQVPGIGVAAVTKLNAAGITTTFQLLGTFLSFKGEGATVRTVCDGMYQYLKEVGIAAHRSTIVKALAEKLNTWIPGLYEESAL